MRGPPRSRSGGTAPQLIVRLVNPGPGRRPLPRAEGPPARDLGRYPSSRGAAQASMRARPDLGTEVAVRGYIGSSRQPGAAAHPGPAPPGLRQPELPRRTGGLRPETPANLPRYLAPYRDAGAPGSFPDSANRQKARRIRRLVRIRPWVRPARRGALARGGTDVSRRTQDRGRGGRLSVVPVCLALGGRVGVHHARDPVLVVR